MGGNAIKPFSDSLHIDIVRLNKSEVDSLAKEVNILIGKNLVQPKVFPTKNDFGDIDLIGDFKDMGETERKKILKDLDAVGFNHEKNSSVTSFAVKRNHGLFQVDLIHVDEKDMAFTERYMAWGGAGNFLGKVARYYGLKLTAEGLYAPYIDRNTNTQYMALTRDFDEALIILGYEFSTFEKGFKCEKDFLDYVQSGKFFTPEIFTEKNMNHIDRTRSKKRPVFSEFVKTQEGRVASREVNMNKGFYHSSEGFNILFKRFALFRSEIARFEMELHKQTMFADKWNGAMIKNITNLEGKDLGNFMKEFTEKFGSEEGFGKWIERVSKEDIRLFVLAEFAFRKTPKDMDIRVVGGSVRDAILGQKIKDIDYVVLNQTKETMLDRGFSMVGKDFPVFLGPDGREYALARRERQTGQGHSAFSTDTTNVTLEEDLYRRDLTINALALDKDGTLTDPFGGRKDLESRILRNVSDHFKEDPLRVLRTARFYSVLGTNNHGLALVKVSPELRQTLADIVHSGSLKTLPKERILQEISGCLKTDKPSMALRLLHECGALEQILPEVARLDGVPQVPKYHPEGDALTHTLLVLDKSTLLSSDPAVRFAALVHDLGKGITPKEILPRHIGHEDSGIPLVEEVCDRLGVPSEWKKLALTVTQQHLRIHKIEELKPSKIHDLLDNIGGLRKDSEEFFNNVLTVCQADDYGKNRESEYRPRQIALELSNAAMNVTGEIMIQELKSKGRAIPVGPEFGERLREKRITNIRQAKQNAPEKMQETVER